MPSIKKRKTGSVYIESDEDADDFEVDFEAMFNCSGSKEPRKPIILKPEIMNYIVNGNEVTQLWGLPNPCKCEARHNTADVIVSAIEFWNPFALLKLLDLSVSQFHWRVSVAGMDFCVKKSWQLVQVRSDKLVLFYLVHKDLRWQLLGSVNEGLEKILIPDRSEESWQECQIAKSYRILAGILGSHLPWHQENLKEIKYRCYTTTKDRKRIEIHGLEAAGENATVADKCSTPEQIPIQSDTDTKIKTVTANTTNTEKTDQAHLQGTKKRKCAVE
ncbi:hypothetical protein ACHAQE_008778 [Botrytis cinerea]